ncbi:hypothetical protein SORBI_3003G245500 [Sorghum bicolor]|uniref:F-box domain-containing protein n=1 Tax=Sorghum bicolor TaxID=4558 RepID=A0A1W0VYT9_SORBI|nr:hypothetical protein SORBI_3003G245500 [Sorghum bicolor]
MASIASIPAEILILIFTYLQCFADLTSVAGVCRDWRKAVHLRLCASQQDQLPWLLQPSHDDVDDAPPSTITSYVSGTTGRRRISLPEGVRRRTDRFCGSHDGGWVAVAADRRLPCYRYKYKLVNLINQGIASIPLPNKLRSHHPTRSDVVEIRMVTLSDVPTAGSCIAAAHTVGGYPSIIFCRPHVDAHWVPPLMDTEPLQDTLYYRGELYEGFYSITSRDNLYLFMQMEINNNNNNRDTLAMSQFIVSFSPTLDIDGRMAGSTITRYLVESRGKLLVVARYSGRATGIDLRTVHFRVFELEIFPMPNAAGHSASLVELQGLDGRVITVARGCSRSFEAGQCKGFQGGSIYFLDDAVGAGRMSSIFSFTDFGMYSMGETKIERPGLPIPALRGSLDGRAEYHNMLAGREPASNSLYGPRELMVRTIRNVSHDTEPVISRLQIVSEIDHVANDEASSSTSAGGGELVVHETVASVWPLLCESGNHHRPVWFMPPSVDEWLVPPPAAADA